MSRSSKQFATGPIGQMILPSGEAPSILEGVSPNMAASTWQWVCGLCDSSCAHCRRLSLASVWAVVMHQHLRTCSLDHERCMIVSSGLMFFFCRAPISCPSGVQDDGPVEFLPLCLVKELSLPLTRGDPPRERGQLIVQWCAWSPLTKV